MNESKWKPKTRKSGPRAAPWQHQTFPVWQEEIWVILWSITSPLLLSSCVCSSSSFDPAFMPDIFLHWNVQIEPDLTRSNFPIEHNKSVNITEGNCWYWHWITSYSVFRALILTEACKQITGICQSFKNICNSFISSSNSFLLLSLSLFRLPEQMSPFQVKWLRD